MVDTPKRNYFSQNALFFNPLFGPIFNFFPLSDLNIIYSKFLEKSDFSGKIEFFRENIGYFRFFSEKSAIFPYFLPFFFLPIFFFVKIVSMPPENRFFAEKSAEKSDFLFLAGSLHETEFRLYASSWKKLWKLFLPPKIISFLWRLCNSCIPVSVRLLDKGMNLSTCCVLCGQGQKHYWHLFYDCTYSSSCWAATNVVKSTLTTDEFLVWLLKLIDALDPDVMCSIAMILWCVWRQRNQKLSLQEI